MDIKYEAEIKVEVSESSEEDNLPNIHLHKLSTLEELQNLISVENIKSLQNILNRREIVTDPLM
ncbi:hypothetical protein Avbf_04174 [Armadillidium vulgare]|nr:hypothetical protein Avbf_04174 [Armadillidium vulgare]